MDESANPEVEILAVKKASPILEEDKRKKRAERFNIKHEESSAVTTSTIGVVSVSAEEDLKLAKRKERFGFVTEAKRDSRAARFGGATDSSPTTAPSATDVTVSGANGDATVNVATTVSADANADSTAAVAPGVNGDTAVTDADAATTVSGANGDENETAPPVVEVATAAGANGDAKTATDSVTDAAATEKKNRRAARFGGGTQ